MARRMFIGSGLTRSIMVSGLYQVTNRRVIWGRLKSQRAGG